MLVAVREDRDECDKSDVMQTFPLEVYYVKTLDEHILRIGTHIGCDTKWLLQALLMQ